MIPRERALAVRAWYVQLAAAAETPGLVQHLVRHWGELLPRFAAYYRMLRALPRRVRRALERCRGLSYASVALMLALCGGAARAATIHADEVTCHLADAIVASNDDVATGGCAAGSGDDTILLDSDVVSGATLPALTSVITIQAGAGSILDGSGTASPCLHVDASGVAVLSGLTIRNCLGFGVQNEGPLTLDHCTVTGNAGGGVSSSKTVTSIADSTIGENVGSGVSFTGTRSDDKDMLLLERTVVSTNVGTGVKIVDGDASVSVSTISGNTGAGIETSPIFDYSFFHVALTVAESTISGNGMEGIRSSAGYGPALITIEKSTISGNAGIAVRGVFYDEISLADSTITGNGGGVLLLAYFADRGASLSISGTIVSGDDIWVRYVRVLKDEHNLFGENGFASVVGFTPGPTDLVPEPGVFAENILAPLADNGGPTRTHALFPFSLPLDAIPASDPSCQGTTDQRGLPRPAGPGCDIGAFELGASRAVAGSTTGIALEQSACRNRTTRRIVKDASGSPSWDCEALGLSVSPGDTVDLRASGTVNETGARVGGAVTGVSVQQVYCRNLSTGQSVQSPSNEVVWDCYALGVSQQPGDKVQTGAIGTVAESGDRAHDRGTADARTGSEGNAP